MKTKNSFAVFFYPRLNRTKNGSAPLIARLTVNKQRKEISLKYNIPVDKWNATKQTVSGSSPEITSLNKYISEIRTELHNAYRQLQIEKKLVTADAIKAIFLGEEEDAKSVMQVIQYHNDTMKDVLAWGTAKNYYTTQKYVKEFLQVKLKTSDIYLTQLNYKFLTDFDVFLRNHVPGENQKPCSNNTVMKHIERFRKIITMAIKNEWLKHDPFLKFKPTFIKKDRGFLSEEELEAIENKQIENVSLSTVRDLFVFSCYTGLAFIDAYNLKPDNLNKGIDGRLWITIHRQKTDVKSQIPLLPKALEILDIYKNHPKVKRDGTLLPMLTNQRFNSYLKEIADITGVTKNLTHHLARHTFATTICLSNGISMEATSGMLGHASMRTTQIYGKILPKRISSEMEVLIEKFNNRKTNSLGFVREAQ
ncbi:MAG: site-specific integrase [Bacteroidota bacterium]|nr:site-specific integrase [Bacteroidota bacterium]MDP3144199.1 site-specific integrase [Bacteroidota bacterium]